MEPLQALQLIDQALGTIEANRSTHAQLQRALSVVSDIVVSQLHNGEKPAPATPDELVPTE